MRLLARFSPTISANGMRVAFESSASNLDPLDGDNFHDIYVRELDATPTTFLASVNAAGTVKGNDYSRLPTISADGMRIALPDGRSRTGRRGHARGGSSGGHQ